MASEFQTTGNQNVEKWIIKLNSIELLGIAHKDNLDLLAACPVKAERINGKHVYYETQEECRFEGTNDREFLDSLH